jgi:hypothetical protein
MLMEQREKAGGFCDPTKERNPRWLLACLFISNHGVYQNTVEAPENEEAGGAEIISGRTMAYRRKWPLPHSHSDVREPNASGSEFT